MKDWSRSHALSGNAVKARCAANHSRRLAYTGRSAWERGVSAVGTGDARDEGALKAQGARRRTRLVPTRCVGMQLQPPRRLKRLLLVRGKPQRGFTLLELTVVLIVVVLGFSVIGLNLSSGNDATEIKAAARDIVSALRYARGQALMTHQETTVALDLSDNSYTVSGRDKLYQIPKAIDVTVVTAQTELTGEGTASIRFFGDGSSTGGRITLERGHAAWKIDINWLTGQIELESK